MLTLKYVIDNMDEKQALLYKKILESCSNAEYCITVELKYDECEEKSSLIIPELPYVHVSSYDHDAYNFKVHIVNDSAFKVLDVESMSALTNDFMLELLYTMGTDVECNDVGVFFYNSSETNYTQLQVRPLDCHFWSDGSSTSSVSIISIFIINAYLNAIGKSDIVSVTFDRNKNLHLTSTSYAPDDIRNIMKEINSLSNEVFTDLMYSVLDTLIDVFKKDKKDFISGTISKALTSEDNGNRHLGVLSRIQIMTTMMQYIYHIETGGKR